MIKAVIFDWAGTTIDYGSFAPVEAFVHIFRQYGIKPTMEEVRAPMGKLKKDHIRTMLEMPRIQELWMEEYGQEYTEQDLNNMYSIYETQLLSVLHQYAMPNPYVLETVADLRKLDIKIGSTTGYTDKMMEIVAAEAKKQGYEPDCYITPDSTSGKGRPYPYMIFENMKSLAITSVEEVMKVGDTIADIEEGKHAGVFTVGVIEGSNLLGLTQEEYKVLSSGERTEHQQRVKKAYLAAGADGVILNMAELIPLIHGIERIASAC